MIPVKVSYNQPPYESVISIENSKYDLRSIHKAFRHVETLFVQGNQVRTDQNKPLFVCLFVLFVSFWGLFLSVRTWLPWTNKVYTCRNALLNLVRSVAIFQFLFGGEEGGEKHIDLPLPDFNFPINIRMNYFPNWRLSIGLLRKIANYPCKNIFLKL